MAIIIEGLSTCPICNLVLSSDDVILTPPFIGNLKDELFMFSDAGIHIECLNNHALKDKLVKNIHLYNKQGSPLEQRCMIEGERIVPVQNMVSFGLLTSNEAEQLYEFNYHCFNLKNIHKWKELNKFLFVANEFLAAGKWESYGGFNKLEDIVAKIQKEITGLPL